MMSRYWGAAILAAWAVAGSAQSVEPAEWREEPLEIDVNSAAPQPLVALREAPDSLWLEARVFHALRLRLPAAPPRMHAGHRYYPLLAISGLSLSYDAPRQRVHLQVPPGALELSARVFDRSRAPAPT